MIWGRLSDHLFISYINKEVVFKYDWFKMCWMIVRWSSSNFYCKKNTSVGRFHRNGGMGSGWRRAFGNRKEAIHGKTENHITSNSPTISASNPSSPRSPFSVFKNTLRLSGVSSNCKLYSYIIFNLLPEVFILIPCRLVVACVCRGWRQVKEWPYTLPSAPTLFTFLA